jgi:hypothetical protein
VGGSGVERKLVACDGESVDPPIAMIAEAEVLVHPPEPGSVHFAVET